MSDQVSRNQPLRVCYFGTYSMGEGYPRNTVVMSGLRQAGATVIECHAPLFSCAEDKVKCTRRAGAMLRVLVRLALCYLRLIVKFMRSDDYDVLLVGYGGLGDVFLARALWIFRRRPVVYDAFLSVYDTVVHDRKLCRPSSFKARLVWWYDYLMCQLADLVLIDTKTHIEYFVGEFGLPWSKFLRVFVGTDKEGIEVAPAIPTTAAHTCDVIFWGNYLPLHGMETMVASAQRLQAKDQISVTLIGSGQGKQRIIEMSENQPTPWLHILPGMSYDELVPRILASDICLGTFGSTNKAQRVIPCKIFECMYYSKPIIAGDTPAARELLSHMTNAYLVPCADPEALADALVRLAGDAELRERLASGARATFDQRCTHLAIGRDLLDPLCRLAGKSLIPQNSERIEPGTEHRFAPHFETSTTVGHSAESSTVVS